jgi:NAD(P)-dependent dehydrogenase (short-subunit alcohol dehydrogenase family)
MSINEMNYSLSGRTALITGAVRRLGYHMAITVARAGANVILHHAHSPKDADKVQHEIQEMGVSAGVVTADLSDTEQVQNMFHRALAYGPIDILINNAAIFEALDWKNTTLNTWQEHMNINLTAPFLLSQAFASAIPLDNHGRIINILDWRAERPGADHFPYNISKAGLAALTKSLAVALAPRITVNGLAFGAILPPSDGSSSDNIIKNVPARRWANLDEVSQSLLFLLTGPEYITGEIIHLDGGRHLI